MGGLFGVASSSDPVTDLFFGTDYHSHLGTKRGGLAVYSREKGFNRAIHNIENSPFRTKFERDVLEISGEMGIGCISDTDPQPLIVRSQFGSFAIATVGRINNLDELLDVILENGKSHFMEQSGGLINVTEIVASLVSAKKNITDGIRFAQERISGSMTMLILSAEGIYCARDKFGRTPMVIGKKEDGYCASFESSAYLNLGYHDAYELGPGEIVLMKHDGIATVSPAHEEMKICGFLWSYYGYPTSSYEGVNVEQMRYRCGANLSEHDDVDVDFIAGVPDSGTAHAIGYANKSGKPFARPLIKYTPTWTRSFTPSSQKMRNLVARMKLISVDTLIKDRKFLLIDDSIVRGTQLRETVDFLYDAGAMEVHVRSACPPIMFGCKYLNFSRSTSDMDLMTHRVMKRLEGENYTEHLSEYIDQKSEKHKKMVEEMGEEMGFTSLKFLELEEMLTSIGIEKCKICTYCWNGKE